MPRVVDNAIGCGHVCKTKFREKDRKKRWEKENYLSLSLDERRSSWISESESAGHAGSARPRVFASTHLQRLFGGTTSSSRDSTHIPLFLPSFSIFSRWMTRCMMST